MVPITSPKPSTAAIASTSALANSCMLPKASNLTACLWRQHDEYPSHRAISLQNFLLMLEWLRKVFFSRLFLETFQLKEILTVQAIDISHIFNQFSFKAFQPEGPIPAMFMASRRQNESGLP